MRVVDPPVRKQPAGYSRKGNVSLNVQARALRQGVVRNYREWLPEIPDDAIPTLGEGMPMWREKLFASMHRNAAAAADFLNLPTNRIVELGAKVEI